MPTIKVWNYIKKLNSTGRPSSEPLATYTITLKSPTSINAPVILLDTGGTMPQFNYVLWDEIHQYYYVSDIVSRNNNIFEIHCNLDALATARPYILNSSAFCKYISDDNYINEYLRDDRIVATADIETLTSSNNFTDLETYNYNRYQWILTTFSKDSGLSSYLVSGLTIYYLTKRLTEDGTSVWGSITQLFGDAKNSIIDLHYIPFKLENLQQTDIVADQPSRIYLGDYDTGSDGYLVNSYLYEISDLISIPSGVIKDFRIASPYTEAKLYCPLIGCIEIPLEEFQDVTNITFKYVCNLGNGNVSISIGKNGNANIISTSSGNFSLSMPLGFQQMNGLSALVGIASAVGGIVSGGALTIAGISGAVASFSNAFKKTTTSMNAFAGNFSGNMNNQMRLVVTKRGISETPENIKTLYGSPCGKVVSLSGVTEGAYVETSQFSLAAPFDEFLINKVNQLMDTGVYLQ